MKAPFHTEADVASADRVLTDWGVERIGEISAGDIAAEGFADAAGWVRAGQRDALCSAWDGMYSGGPFAWAKSPWVWVVSFRRIPQPSDSPCSAPASTGSDERGSAGSRGAKRKFRDPKATPEPEYDVEWCSGGCDSMWPIEELRGGVCLPCRREQRR